MTFRPALKPPRYGGIKSLICVTGDRNWSDKLAIARVLSKRDHRTVVMTGLARGVDRLADESAKALGMPTIGAAYFGTFGPAGGPFRNQFMVSVMVGLKDHLGWRVEVLAFHDDIARSSGTKNMVEECRRVGLEVKIYGHKKQA